MKTADAPSFGMPSPAMQGNLATKGLQPGSAVGFDRLFEEQTFSQAVSELSGDTPSESDLTYGRVPGDTPIEVPSLSVPGASGPELLDAKVGLASELRQLEAEIKTGLVNAFASNTKSDEAQTNDQMTKTAIAVGNVLSEFDRTTEANSQEIFQAAVLSLVDTDADTVVELDSEAIVDGVFAAVFEIIGLDRPLVRQDATTSQTLLLSSLPGLKAAAKDLTSHGLPKTTTTVAPGIATSLSNHASKNSDSEVQIGNHLSAQSAERTIQVGLSNSEPVMGAMPEQVADSKTAPAPAALSHVVAGMARVSVDDDTTATRDSRVRAVLEKMAAIMSRVVPTEQTSVSNPGDAVGKFTGVERVQEHPATPSPQPVINPLAESVHPVELDAGHNSSMGRVTQQPGEPNQSSRFFGMLAAQIKGVNISENRTRIELTPKGLGGIEIDMTQDEAGRLQIVVRADNVMVLESLRNDREALMTLLSDSGISTEMGDLDFEEFKDRANSDETELMSADADNDAPEPDDGRVAHQPTISGKTLDILT